MESVGGSPQQQPPKGGASGSPESLPHRSAREIRFRALGTVALRRVTLAFEPVRGPLRRRAVARAPTRPPTASPVPIVFLLIYRQKNVALVQKLLGQLDARADVRLWALDEVAPELAELTMGSGPGWRFENLNSLYDSRPVASGSWLVVADDDVIFMRGDVGSVIRTMMRADLNLAQPAESVLGWWTQMICVARPFCIARDTNHVEIGPLFVADPEFASAMLPFPSDGGMGWGVEADWYRIKADRYRIGVVDACRVLHLSRAVSYSYAAEVERADERLAAAGVTNIWQLRTSNARWWRWQRRPPWSGARPAPQSTPSASG